MNCPVFRLHDGFNHASPQVRDQVKELQAELNREGFSLKTGGLFGCGTEDAVKHYQGKHGLGDDGIVGRLTWAVLLRKKAPDLKTVFPITSSQNDIPLLNGWPTRPDSPRFKYGEVQPSGTVANNFKDIIFKR